MEFIDKNMKAIIANSRLISFDIYDTAVLRDLLDPSDVFDLVNENQYEVIEDFKILRINAEKKCRKRKNGLEVTLDEIYSELFEFLGNSTNSYKEKEIYIEKNIVIPNKEIKKLYDYCISTEKKVIFTSDMYLDIETIKYILKKCGYHKYDKIYLSSVYKYKKRNGLLYEQILRDYNINSNEILHIGDNRKSDFYEARKKGLKAYHYRRENKKNVFENKEIHDIILDGFLKNRVYDNIFKQIGFSVVGPLLYGFCNWLKKNENQYNPDKIIFLARDGLIIKKMYENIFGFKEKNMYIYASRRSLIVPTLWKNCTIENIQNSIKFHNNMRLEEVLERLGLEASDVENEMRQIGIKSDCIIQASQLANDIIFSKLFLLIKDKIAYNSKKEYEYAKCYWENVISTSNNIFIVDIGWNGNMQNAIEKLISFSGIKNVSIKGFYFGVNPLTKYKMDMNGFIYDRNKNQQLKSQLDLFSVIFETCFMTDHGSVKKYLSSNEVEFYESEYESEQGKVVDEIKSINLIQDSALKFASEFSNRISIINHKISNESYYNNIFNLGLHPTIEVAQKLGDFRFFNSSYSYIARTNNILDINCFLNSNWKIGYLKRYLKLPIRYDLLISKLKYVFKREV